MLEIELLEIPFQISVSWEASGSSKFSANLDAPFISVYPADRLQPFHILCALNRRIDMETHHSISI